MHDTPSRLSCVCAHDKVPSSRKDDVVDNDRTTLKTSQLVNLLTRNTMHQKLSPCDDARGSYARYAVAPVIEHVTWRKEATATVRKADVVDNGLTALKTSEPVNLPTMGTMQQKSSPCDDARGSYAAYAVALVTELVTWRKEGAEQTMSSIMAGRP